MKPLCLELKTQRTYNLEPFNEYSRKKILDRLSNFHAKVLGALY